jgi:hypothetical protein
MKPTAQGVFGSQNAKHRHYPRWAAAAAAEEEEEEEEEDEGNSRTKGEHQLLATHAKRKKH